MKLNKHYSELNESYLFSTIAHKVAAYQKANPDKDIIRLGIGDVTLPLAKSVTDAMLKAVEEQGKKETFHGYIPSEQGYEFLRSAIQKYYAGHGVELDMAEIFVSDGAKSDLGNLLDLFDVDNTVLVPDPVYREKLEALLTIPFSFAPAHVNRQRAAAVGALAEVYYKEGKIQTAEEHEPEYLRKSQAERERAERESVKHADVVKKQENGEKSE